MPTSREEGTVDLVKVVVLWLHKVIHQTEWCEPEIMMLVEDVACVRRLFLRKR